MTLSFWRGPSLVWKILLAAMIPVTAVIAFTGWLVRDQTVKALTRDLQAEVRTSLEAYESLWNSRAETLRSISMVLSTMSDVRAAFQTNDRATIRDSAGEIWSKVSGSDAIFLVTDPRGEVLASLGGEQILADHLDIVREASPRFPAQVTGFSVGSDATYEVVITPVYVQTGAGPGLLVALVAGFAVDQTVLNDLKKRTGDSDFIFAAHGGSTVSTLPSSDAGELVAKYRRGADLQRISSHTGEFAVLGSILRDIHGNPAGDLLIVRSFEPVRNSIRQLQQRLLWIWLAAIIAASAVSYLLARRILRPIHELDRAATRLAAQDFSVPVPETGDDELQRLARTFNQMSQSIQNAREDLIRHERIETIGRLATSIVHDLRNPLASIYGGAEMMIDGDLNETQMVRVARNIYRSSRVIKDLLQELSDLSRGRIQVPEPCVLHEVIAAAVQTQTASAEQQGVTIENMVDSSLELSLERARIERVFLNLISNAIEAMPRGGRIRISAEARKDVVEIRVADTGPGVPAEIRKHLFQPFVTSRKTGLGLGLALSREAVVAHGGTMWVEDAPGGGACFCIRLPVATVTAGDTKAVSHVA